MTDRIYALTVYLDKPTRDDDVEWITNAIRMIRGVSDVKEHVTNREVDYAVDKARRELEDKLWTALRGDK